MNSLAATAPRRVARRSPVRAAIVTARPRQWIKNALVIAAPGAAGVLLHDGVPLRVGVATVAFCLLASGIYAINDVRDVEEDRRHPRKRHRPVAARELEERTATMLGIGLMASGLALCLAVRPLLGLVGAGYLALTLTYTMVLRHMLVLDVIAIAGGFVLRAVAGGVAAPVTLSIWFILVVSCGSVLVASGKRWAELRRTEEQGTARRRVLHHYSFGRLQVLLALSSAGAMVAYIAWAFQLGGFHPWRYLTVFPFAAGLVRYGWLLRAGKGETPEDMLIEDAALAVASFAWLLLFAIDLHGGI